MVDLDSNPTKLIEIVEIGKQLLITRGSLTTFSIANDIAKYFAIIPAMFAGVFAGLDTLNIMRLAPPGVGDPVRGHLQRADHRRADPAGPARRALHAVLGRVRCCAATSASTASAASSPRSSASSSSTCSSPRSPASAEEGRAHAMATEPPPNVRQYLAALRTLLVLTVLLGLAYPLVMTGIAQVAFHDNAERVARHRDGKHRRVRPDRTGVHPARRGERQAEAGRRRQPGRRARPGVLPEPALRGRHRLRPAVDLRVEPRSGERGPHRRGQGAPRHRRRASTASRPSQVPPDALLASGSGLDPHISPAYAREQVARVARERGLSVAAGAGTGRRAHPGPHHSASSASRGSTCSSSTWRWTGLGAADGRRPTAQTGVDREATHEPRQAAGLPRRGPRRRQDLRHARRGPPAGRARHRRGRRPRRDPRPAAHRRACSRDSRSCPGAR